MIAGENNLNDPWVYRECIRMVIAWYVKLIMDSGPGIYPSKADAQDAVAP